MEKRWHRSTHQMTERISGEVKRNERRCSTKQIDRNMSEIGVIARNRNGGGWSINLTLTSDGWTDAKGTSASDEDDDDDDEAE